MYEMVGKNNSKIKRKAKAEKHKKCFNKYLNLCLSTFGIIVYDEKESI